MGTGGEEVARNLHAAEGNRGPRIGRFILPYGPPLGQDVPLKARHLDPVALAIFRECIPLRAEYSYSFNGMEYVAVNPGFEPAIDEEPSILFCHETIPEYGWTVSLTRNECGNITGLAMPHRLGPGAMGPHVRCYTGDPLVAAAVRGCELITRPELPKFAEPVPSRGDGDVVIAEASDLTPEILEAIEKCGPVVTSSTGKTVPAFTMADLRATVDRFGTEVPAYRTEVTACRPAPEPVPFVGQGVAVTDLDTFLSRVHSLEHLDIEPTEALAPKQETWRDRPSFL